MVVLINTSIRATVFMYRLVLGEEHFEERNVKFLALINSIYTNELTSSCCCCCSFVTNRHQCVELTHVTEGACNLLGCMLHYMHVDSSHTLLIEHQRYGDNARLSRIRQYLRSAPAVAMVTARVINDDDYARHTLHNISLS